MGYTLEAALESIDAYKSYPAYATAVKRLTIIAQHNPRGLYGEAARIRSAFYVYDQGFNYGKAA